MSTYKVVNKHHFRATTVAQDVIDARGNPFTILHAGSAIRFEVGALIHDLSPAELEAFPDRFQLVEGEPLALSPAQVQRINPEVFALLQRAHKGEATADEQEIVGDLLEWVTAHATGTATDAQTRHVTELLEAFGMLLLVE